MPTQIDHVLIANRVLEQTITDFEQLGFNVFPGGTHHSGKSRNALVSFQDGTYLELIAPVNPDGPFDEATTKRFATGDGLIAFAVSSDNVAGAALHLAHHGLEVSPVNSNGRVRPDGKRTDWQTIRVTSPDDVALPFIISDVTPRNIRVPDGDDAVHPNGVTRVLGLTNVVSNLAATAKLYQDLFHDPGTSVETGIEGAGKALRFAIGDQWLELVEPAEGGNQLRTYLEAKGPRPYEIVFGTGPSDSRGTLQDTNLSHNARLRFVAAGD
jgi:hypothetical protein